ncbi:MAG: tetratricopeptide repeat protein [Planctomycetota bacterium]|jgi:tetratricopeptide (TPR) repeat protein
MHPKLLGIITIPALCLFAVAQETPTSRPSTQTSEAEAEWLALLEQSVALLNQRKTAESTVAARAALTLAEASFGETDEKTVKTQLNLSTMLLLQGKLDEAEELAVKAHETSLQKLDHARSRVATSLKFLGNFYMQRGKLDEAQQVFEEAIDLSTRAEGAEHPETAKHIGNLAALHLKRKNFEQAEELFEQTLEIWAAQAKPHPVYTAGAMTNLAALYLETGKHDEVRMLYIDAYQMQLDAFGPESPRRLNLLRNYASILDQLEEKDRAEEIRAEIEVIEGKQP